MAKLSIFLVFLLGNIALGSDIIGIDCEQPKKPGFTAILSQCDAEHNNLDSICFLPGESCDENCLGMCPKISGRVSVPCEVVFRCTWDFISTSEENTTFGPKIQESSSRLTNEESNIESSSNTDGSKKETNSNSKFLTSKTSLSIGAIITISVISTVLVMVLLFFGITYANLLWKSVNIDKLDLVQYYYLCI